MPAGEQTKSASHSIFSMVNVCIAFVTLLFAAAPDALAQRAITASSPATESFDIGTSATAPLPGDFRADKLTSARTVGHYDSALSATDQRGGSDNFIGGGIYNFAAGDATTATDRAIGFLASTAVKSGNLYGYFQAAPGIGSFSVAYDVEKYHNGMNAAGFGMQLYYSTNGTNFTSAGSTFLTSFAADTDNATFATPPGMTSHVTGTLDLSAVLEAANAVTNDHRFYLAWNYSVSSGTSTTSPQGLGIDNISIAAAGTESAPEPTTPLLALIGGSTVFSLRRRAAPLQLGRADVYD
ncbi:MAG: hypothetical protein JWM57_4223 [Phycisphaerales bacterium]|nr:hypothetical protein [Phycisphaerales bacterium]